MRLNLGQAQPHLTLNAKSIRLFEIALSAAAIFQLIQIIFNYDFLLGSHGVTNKLVLYNRLQWSHYSLFSLQFENNISAYVILSFGLIIAFCLLKNKFHFYAHFGLYVIFTSILNACPWIDNLGLNLQGLSHFWLSALYGVLQIESITKDLREFIAYWCIRVLKIHICLIYFFAGISKTNSFDWMSGTAVFEIINVLGTGFAIPKFTQTSILNNIMTYASMAVELAAPWLLWHKKNSIILTILILLHASLVVTMNITFLNQMMVVLIILFIHDEDLISFKI